MDTRILRILGYDVKAQVVKMTSTGKNSGRKDSRRGIALSDETIERIRRAMAAAVLSGEKDYPQTVSAFVSAATEEKLSRDLSKYGLDGPPRR